MIKREARILGLSARRKGRTILVVGVAFRGSLWLDGVISCLLEMKGTNQNSTLSGAIKRSKQYSQLHAIIVKKQFAFGFELDLDDLALRLNLPVITITNRHISKAPKKGISQRGLQRYDIIVNGHDLSVLAVRISRVGVQQVFKVGCGPTSSIPEAVRVANLLVQESSRCRFLWQRRKLKIGRSHTTHPRIKSV